MRRPHRHPVGGENLSRASTVVTRNTIRIFLADGEPTGILLAEFSNWTGKVLVVPPT